MDIRTFSTELDKKRRISTESKSEKINYLKVDKERFDIRWKEIEKVLETEEDNITRMLNLLATYKWDETPRRIVYAQHIDRKIEKAKLAEEGFRIVAKRFLGINNRYACTSFTWMVKNTRNKERYQYYAVKLTLYWATHYHRMIDGDYSVESGKGSAKQLSYTQMQEVLLAAYHNGPATHWE